MLRYSRGMDELPTFLIPECCREGWEQCPHVIQKQKPQRTNIAL